MDLNDGFNDGLKQGTSNRNIEIVKIMLREKMNADTISKITGLSVDEINDLK